MTFAYIFDIGAAFVLAFSVVRGVKRGITGEVLSLLGLIASVLSGWTFARPMAAAVLYHFPTWNPAVTELACAAAIFFGVSMFFAVIGRIIQALVKAANLSFLDHAMGAAVGGLRAFIIVLFIYGVMSIFSPLIPDEWMNDSLAMEAASWVWPSVFNFMAENGWIDPNRLTQLTP